MAGGFGPPSCSFNSIAEAAQAQHVEAVLQLLADGKNINAQDQDGNSALHWAAWFKLDVLVKDLLSRNIRIDLGNKLGEAAAHWAAKSANVVALGAIVRWDIGAVSQRDCDGFTPFIICAQNDSAAVMEWMYLKGICVEEQDDWGRTALHWACYKGNRRAVQWLLSRSANVAHRDHEGMTAIHWAALQGHGQVAEMLLDVGAVQLLHVTDAVGDTPIDLARRKKHRYMVASFHKCQLVQMILGRPNISHNHFATFFALFAFLNLLVFMFVLAPGTIWRHWGIVLGWVVLMTISMVLWWENCFSDPGWLQPQTIFPQHNMIGDDPTRTFDAEQPVESQMVHQESISGNVTDDPNDHPSARVTSLEMTQSRLCFQRQLITKARRRLDDDPCCGAANMYRPLNTTETQPLIVGVDGSGREQFAWNARDHSGQLERAELALQTRERAMCHNLSQVRENALIAQHGADYLNLLDRGEFKQVCVVCRARREMRSHHCKECGRCVRRLDHHCPWIDNCVGLGNQRLFYCFIVVLLATLLWLYLVVFEYLFDAVRIQQRNGAGFIDMVRAFSKASLMEKLSPLMVLLIFAINLVWLAFVGALVARHSVYMMMNITTYEVLMRPSHVERRFPKGHGRFWFLAGCGVMDCITNIFNYWTVNTESDADVFMGEPQAVQPGPPPPSLEPTPVPSGRKRSKASISKKPDTLNTGHSTRPKMVV